MDYRDEGEIRKESDYVYYCLTQRLLQKTVAIILHAILYSLTNPQSTGFQPFYCHEIIWQFLDNLNNSAQIKPT